MNRTIGTGGLLMMLVVALAAIGIGIALWSKVLTIHGVVRTGAVNAEFTQVFTDDDDAVDNADKDAADTGDCAILVGPEVPPSPFLDKRTGPGTSCDPSATGRDPKGHYDKDVARCDAMAVPDGQDDESQPGSQRALLAISNAYPSYHCTAWFDVVNSGSIPVLLHSLAIQGGSAVPCASGGSTPYDLNGDGQPDIEICVSEIPVCPGERCEPQIDPRDTFQFNLDIHVMQTALQGTDYIFEAVACLHQWNEETGQCPQQRVLLYNGNAGPDAGTIGLSSLKAHYEGLGYAVDYTNVWPGSLSAYALVYINGPGFSDDSGAAFFTAAQKGDLSTYMSGGGRVVVAGDHSGLFGISTVNDLLAAISGNISQNADVATPDNDACAPMTDITANAVTAGVAAIDPSATSSLTIGGPAISLARVDALPFDCGGAGVINGATYLARDGRLVVIGDLNTFDDFGFSDPAGDGNNAQLATNLATY